MLKFYRNNIKTIIWLIVISFVAWGVGTLSVSTQSAASYAGSVWGQKISQKEFMVTMRFYDLLMRSEQRSDPNAEPLSYEALKALSWQTIIVSRKAKELDIQIADEDIRSEIEKIFSIDGGFSFNFYQDWIQKNFAGRAREFEEVIRKHLAVQRIRQKIVGALPEDQRDSQWVNWMSNAIGSARFKDFTLDNNA